MMIGPTVTAEDTEENGWVHNILEVETGFTDVLV